MKSLLDVGCRFFFCLGTDISNCTQILTCKFHIAKFCTPFFWAEHEATWEVAKIDLEIVGILLCVQADLGHVIVVDKMAIFRNDQSLNNFST